MAYNPSTFIRTYSTTDRIIQIENEFGIKSFSINICNYQKSLVQDKNLILYFEESDATKKFILEFANSSDSLLGEIAISNAINTLKPNCLPVLNPTNPVTTPVPITYLQYQTLRTANNLVPLQYYDVTDSTNLLGLGTVVYRVLAKTNNDKFPQGIITSQSEIFVIIDTVNSIFKERKNLIRNISLNGDSTIVEPTFNNTNLILHESSGTFNNSNYIVSKKSINNTLTDCNNVELNNVSNLIVSTLSNVQIKDITSINLQTLFPGGLSDVSINKTTSIGKEGFANWYVDSSQTDLTFSAYKDKVNLSIEVGDLPLGTSFTSNIYFKNLITVANSIFRVKFNFVNTTDDLVIINLKDFTSNTTFFTGKFSTIQNKTFECRWNLDLQIYELLDVLDKKPRIEKKEIFTPTNGQTIFNLKYGTYETVVYPEINANLLEMFVNGQKQTMGLDYTFTSPNVVTFQNRGFTLSTSDEVEFVMN